MRDLSLRHPIDPLGVTSIPAGAKRHLGVGITAGHGGPTFGARGEVPPVIGLERVQLRGEEGETGFLLPILTNCYLKFSSETSSIGKFSGTGPDG